MYAPKGNLRCFNKYSKPFFVCLQRAPIELIRWPTLRPCKFGPSPNVTPILLYGFMSARMRSGMLLNPPDHFTNRSPQPRAASAAAGVGCIHPDVQRYGRPASTRRIITEYSINECISVAQKHFNLACPLSSRLTSAAEVQKPSSCYKAQCR